MNHLLDLPGGWSLLATDDGEPRLMSPEGMAGEPSFGAPPAGWLEAAINWQTGRERDRTPEGRAVRTTIFRWTMPSGSVPGEEHEGEADAPVFGARG